MEKLLKIIQNSDTGQWWDNHFTIEREPWGKESSITTKYAADSIHSASKVLVVGFGYGREIEYLIKKGHKVSGIDISREGFKLTKSKLQEKNLYYEKLAVGKFETQDVFGPNSFDVLISHRVLQLVINKDSLKKWILMADSVLKNGGQVFISCRNYQDIDENLIPTKYPFIYMHKGRFGHKITLWDEKVFRYHFGEHFENFSFQEIHEIESKKTGKICNLTMMNAQKRK